MRNEKRRRQRMAGMKQISADVTGNEHTQWIVKLAHSGFTNMGNSVLRCLILMYLRGEIDVTRAAIEAMLPIPEAEESDT